MTRSEVADGMRIEFDVAIPMDGGLVLRADVFRPIGDGRYPAILSYGAYGARTLRRAGIALVRDHPCPSPRG
jgi:hypothetical protein